MEYSSNSLCIRICTLDEDDVCLGCGRTLEEIKAWQSYSDEQRMEVGKMASKRVQVFEQRSIGLQEARRTRLLERAQNGRMHGLPVNPKRR